MNVKGKYLVDEENKVISPITSISTVITSDGKTLEQVLNDLKEYIDKTIKPDIIVPEKYIYKLSYTEN